MTYTFESQTYSKTTLKNLEKSFTPSLFQSEQWFVLQDSLPDRELGPLVVIKKTSDSIGYFTSIIHKLPAGQKYAYINRGPVTSSNLLADPIFVEALQKHMNAWCKKEKCLFYRIAPNISVPHEKGHYLSPITSNLEKNSAIVAPSQHQPEFTSIIDISKSPEDILKAMKPKGRYNIKVARKHNVEVKQSTDVDSFFDLVLTTTTRNKFSGNNKAYYSKFIEHLGKYAQLYLAYYEETPVAGIIVAYENNKAIYYYGASDSAYRKYMAPYLIHWQAIEDAQARGCTSYDLFGIAPPDEKNHPWQGITTFKNKFGGTTYQYPKTYDFPTNKLLYHLFMAANSLKKVIRR